MARRAWALLSIPCVLAAHSLAPAASPLRAAVRSIHGRVVEVGGTAAVSEVQVSVAGISVGTKTSAKGTYELRDLPAGTTQLVFRHPCYFPVQITIPADGDIAVSIGLPFDQTSLRRAGCGGAGARKPDSAGASDESRR